MEYSFGADSDGQQLLAERPEALRGFRVDGDSRVGPLAFRLGYTSKIAFSNAFKREVGIEPLRYRASVRFR